MQYFGRDNDNARCGKFFCEGTKSYCSKSVWSTCATYWSNVWLHHSLNGHIWTGMPPVSKVSYQANWKRHCMSETFDRSHGQHLSTLLVQKLKELCISSAFINCMRLFWQSFRTRPTIKTEVTWPVLSKSSSLLPKPVQLQRPFTHTRETFPFVCAFHSHSNGDFATENDSV